MSLTVDYHISTGRFAGRRALITGGAQGLGFATAGRLAAEGADIGLIDLNKDAVKAAADRLVQEGFSAVSYGADVTDIGRVEEIVADFGSKGNIDILVPAAGIFPVVDFSKMTMELWRKIIDINLGGFFACASTVLPVMKRQGYGRITAISSETFMMGVPNQAAYIASKGGVIGLVRVLAREGGPHGITANAVLPGLIPTEGLAENSGGDMEKLLDLNLTGQSIPRRGKPEDIADAIAYLSSEGAAFITGQSVLVGGGDFFV